jgi:hypothetical protein
MSVKTLAPIAISTYSRINHLKKVIKALQRNTLASKSELYIFSDAPKLGDEEIVRKVRNYIHTIDGFKYINIIERDTNNRVANNRGGIKQLLDKYGKCIFMEDDIVTAPGFLDFINKGLELYKDRSDIFAVCGYTPPINIQNFYKYDIYLSPRFSAWGFGIWKDRYEKIIMKIKDENFEEFLNNKKLVKKFQQGGEDLMRMLKLEVTGKIDALDVKIFYTQFLLNLNTIAPTHSLTNNIGHDGTGIHCGISKKFEVEIPTIYNKLNLVKDIQLDKRVIKSLYYFRSGFPQIWYHRLVLNIYNNLKKFKRILFNIDLLLNFKKYFN